MIRVTQEKTSVELSIPLHPALIAAIKAAPAKGVTLIGDANGRPIKRATLTLLMRKAVKLAGLPPHCVPHGLRKAIMRRLAETGSSAKEIAAISGHRTLKENRAVHGGGRSGQAVEGGDGQAQRQQKANVSV
jgi:integrase